jgi:TolB-like protein
MGADEALAKMRKSLNPWSETDVNACVERMLASSVFARAERQKRLLRYLVDAALADKADLLKGYTIGVEVFDRDSTFDPAIDAIVRVQAGQLRAKLREYYEVHGGNDSIRFELPKGTYAIRIEAKTQLAFESSETQGSSSALRQPPLANVTPPKTMRPALIEDKPSLAVLPFINYSSDPEQEYFADGITEDLTTELSRISGLFLISRHSAFVYKGMAKRAEEIAAELGVQYLLEGSVRRCERQVRISAQLIDAAFGEHIWAERYDRQLEDIFAVQDDVTRRIVDVLQVKLAGPEAELIGCEGTHSLEAYDMLLRGLERYWVFTPTSTGDAVEKFARAVELDSGYATGHAWLSRALTFRSIMLWDPAAETLDRAYDHARVAVDLDDRLPLAHSMLGWVQLWRRQGEASIAAGRRALTLDPNNADAHLFLSYSLVAAGRAREALHSIEKGMRLNPHPSAVYQYALGLIYFMLDEYENAIAAFKCGIEVTDVFIPNHRHLCMTYTLLGREKEARVEREKVMSLRRGGKCSLQPVFFFDENLSRRMTALAELAGVA